MTLPCKLVVDLVVFDVHPADTSLHRAIFGHRLHRREILARQIAAIENQAQVGMVYQLVEFLQQTAILPDEIGFDFQTENRAATAADFGDFYKPVGGLFDIIVWIFAPWVIKRKSANQPRLEFTGQIHRPLHVIFQILVEGDISIGRTVVDIEQFDLANRRTNRGNLHPEFSV